MSKTSRQIVQEVYTLLQGSTLAAELSGAVYRGGVRPRDSKLEDAVVIFTAGTAGQVQEGIVTINIFIRDIDAYANGVFVEDSERTEQIEAMAAEWAVGLNNGRTPLHFTLADTIHTTAEPSIRQHFVVVKLRYRYYNHSNY